MNLGEVKAFASYLVDDLNMTYFGTTQMTAFANHAQAETQKLLIQAGQNYYITGHTFASVAYQQGYSLPANFLKLNRLEYVIGTAPNDSVYPVNSITMNQQDMFQRYGNYPAAFYFSQYQIQLVPIPDAVTSFRMKYTYRVADMTADANTPDVPTQYHDYLAYLVAIQCFIKDGRDPSTLLQYTMKVEEEIKRDAIERAQDRAPSVVQSTNDDIYW
jgi:hypothetical protein